MESPLETQELKEQLEEAVHHSHGHGAHGGGEHEGPARWITFLSLSTAMIAVVAAVAALKAGSLANEAILVKNDAVLQQSMASDMWGEYQAKKIKGHLYATQGELLPAERKELADKFAEKAKREYDSANEPQLKARELAKVAHEDNEEAEHLLQRHERFAFSVTIFQVAIALSAIAALARKKIVWLVSLAAGAMGLAFFVIGWLPAVKGEAHAEHGSGHTPAHSSEGAPAASAHP